MSAMYQKEKRIKDREPFLDIIPREQTRLGAVRESGARALRAGLGDDGKATKRIGQSSAEES